MRTLIALGPEFHAEPGATPMHLWNVYMTRDVGENARIWVGELTGDAIKAWATSTSNDEAGIKPASHQSTSNDE